MQRYSLELLPEVRWELFSPPFERTDREVKIKGDA